MRSHLRVVPAKRPAADSVRWNHIRTCRHAELRWCLEPGATVPRLAEMGFSGAARSKFNWKVPLLRDHGAAC